ncbi:hypothetical protein LXL04_037440 [Taraxacum kok-saghyz]
MSAGGKMLTSAESKKAFVFWKTKEVCRGKNVCGREDMDQDSTSSLPFHLSSPDRTTIAILKSPAPPPCATRRRLCSAVFHFDADAASFVQLLADADHRTSASFLGFQRLFLPSSDFTVPKRKQATDISNSDHHWPDSGGPFTLFVSPPTVVIALICRSAFQLCLQMLKKQTVFFLQTADVWTTSSSAELCRCSPQTADVLALK